jgi:hypothetical protein
LSYFEADSNTAGRKLHAPGQCEERSPQRQCQFIMLVDESLGGMLISRFGRSSVIDTKQILPHPKSNLGWFSYTKLGILGIRVTRHSLPSYGHGA